MRRRLQALRRGFWGMLKDSTERTARLNHGKHGIHGKGGMRKRLDALRRRFWGMLKDFVSCGSIFFMLLPDDAFNRNSWKTPEINQQTESIPSGSKIIVDLSAMFIANLLYCFHFNHNHLIVNKIRHIKLIHLCPLYSSAKDGCARNGIPCNPNSISKQS